MKRQKTLQAILLASLTLNGFSGCASMTSTPLTRNDDNTFWGDSNGKTRIFARSRPYKGSPVKVKVQSHVDVFVDETYYLKKQDGKWNEQQLANRFFSVRTAPVLSEQIVMVDFKRPASGQLNTVYEFDKDMYFKSIDSKITDTTLKDTADLVGAVAKNLAKSTNGGGEGPQMESKQVEFVPMVRTVAYQRFDINAVDYEQQLECFVNEHLNNCNSCGASPTYDQLPIFSQSAK